jgi:hypothetical protein
VTSSQLCNARRQKNTNRRKYCKSFPAARGEAKKQNLLLQMMTQNKVNTYLVKVIRENKSAKHLKNLLQ